VANATDRSHGHHAEAIEIIFDPTETSELLEFFFQIHGPTTLNRQGNDQGASDRSAIFYTSDEQKDGGLRTRLPTSRLVAPQGGERSGAGQRLLGSRARAPG
jgi:hypothetical protein